MCADTLRPAYIGSQTSVGGDLEKKSFIPIRPATALGVNYLLMISFMILAGRRFPESKFVVDWLFIFIHQAAICIILFVEHQVNIYASTYTKALDRLESKMRQIGKDVAIHNNILELPTFHDFNYSTSMQATKIEIKKRNFFEKTYDVISEYMAENVIAQVLVFSTVNLVAIGGAVTFVEFVNYYLK